jgi:hypothetical protein
MMKMLLSKSGTVSLIQNFEFTSLQDIFADQLERQRIADQ